MTTGDHVRHPIDHFKGTTPVSRDVSHRSTTTSPLRRARISSHAVSVESDEGFSHPH